MWLHTPPHTTLTEESFKTVLRGFLMAKGLQEIIFGSQRITAALQEIIFGSQGIAAAHQEIILGSQGMAAAHQGTIFGSQRIAAEPQEMDKPHANLLTHIKNV